MSDPKSLAIAYSMKKKGNKKCEGGDCGKCASCMASGGTVSSGDPTMNYAEGGDVPALTNKNEQSAEHESDMVGRILKKMYSKGGQVANDTGEGEAADEKPNEFDDLVLRDGLEFKYTGENSGDEDGDDVVKRAMKKKYS